MPPSIKAAHAGFTHPAPRRHPGRGPNSLQAPAQQQLEPDDEEEPLGLTAHAANPTFDNLHDPPRRHLFSL